VIVRKTIAINRRYHGTSYGGFGLRKAIHKIYIKRACIAGKNSTVKITDSMIVFGRDFLGM